MLSIIIATLDSERALVATLSTLVSGATAGLVSEVLVADGGSADDTARVADITGCNFSVEKGPLGRRLKGAAAVARTPWLMWLRPGTILDPQWIDETARFVAQPAARPRAAVFRRAAPAEPGLRQIWPLLAGAFGGRPGPEQGLLISKQFYDSIGGHSEEATDPETELLARIGKSRIITLSSGAGIGYLT
jgi:glycosyltransferase involved in cell wall biosynthesis